MTLRPFASQEFAIAMGSRTACSRSASRCSAKPIENAVMRTVLERVGFRQEGILRRWYPSVDGRGIDRVMYGMTRDDYEDVKPRWI